MRNLLWIGVLVVIALVVAKGNPFPQWNRQADKLTYSQFYEKILDPAHPISKVTFIYIITCVVF